MGIINTNVSRPKRVVRSTIPVPIDLTVTPPYSGAVAGQINSGELVYITSNFKLASLATAGTSNANAAKCVGVALDCYPVTFTVGITGSPVPPGDPETPRIQVYEDGDHLFNTTVGDTYNAYDPVYLGADGRTISKTATGSQIGYVSPDQRQGNGLGVVPVNTPISGAAGVQIYVRIKPAASS